MEARRPAGHPYRAHHRRFARRARCFLHARRGPADRVDQGKILPEQVLSHNSVYLGTVARRERRRRNRQFVRPHVVRWRVDEVARQINRLDDARQLPDI